MVKLPYRSESDVSVPQVVRPHANGKIPKELLHPCGIRNFTMVEPAARACRALVTAALADGVRLDASGTYRSYDEQVKMFTARYSTTAIEGRPTKTWNGERYWLKPDVPGAATPGTSMHGLGSGARSHAAFSQRSAPETRFDHALLAGRERPDVRLLELGEVGGLALAVLPG